MKLLHRCLEAVEVHLVALKQSLLSEDYYRTMERILIVSPLPDYRICFQGNHRRKYHYRRYTWQGLCRRDLTEESTSAYIYLYIFPWGFTVHGYWQ